MSWSSAEVKLVSNVVISDVVANSQDRPIVLILRT